MEHTERAQVWHQHIRDWQTSGLSARAYCQQRSLPYGRLLYWRKKLADPGAAQGEATGFAQVAAVSSASTSESLSVSLPGGVTITGLHAGNIELLNAILRQL